MEVRPGYKQTDVGVVPQDWAVQQLGEIASVAAGGTPSRSVADYWDGDVPWVTTTEINFKTITSTAQFISASGLKNSAARLLDPGTLLLALYGQGKTRGKVSVLGIHAAANQACASIAPLSNVSSQYIFQFLASQYDAIRALSNSGSQENLNGQIVRSLEVPLPSTRAEQEAIAGALSDADGLIESLEQLIAKKGQIKQGAMQELLTGKKRLPGFIRQWPPIRLGELFSFKNGLNKAKEYFGHGTPIVNYMDVFKSSKIYATNLLGRVALTTSELDNFSVRRGDVLFTRTSETQEEIGMAAVVLDTPRQTVFSGFVLRGSPKDDRLADEFKAYCFQSTQVRRQIVSKASYTTRALTNGRILSDVVLPLPDLKEQMAIAEALSDMDAEIEALEKTLDKAHQIKQGMMQELLTGRIRLI